MSSSEAPLPALDALLALVRQGELCVLTGAGCSTESGIPDYRGPETRRRARNPIRMERFLRDPNTRRRYWARSFLGWPRMSGAEPNAAHHGLAELQRRGFVRGLITQNVDSLHERAGSTGSVELHGALRQVVCLDCGAVSSRLALQQRLARDNDGFRAELLRLAPDGDADIPEHLVDQFVAPDCTHCGSGVLKPDVVFFGENVPRPRVERAYAMLDASRALLVIGSSLAVFSGYRFVRRAIEQHKPVALINLGETRADAVASITLQASAGRVVSELVARL